MQNGRPRKLILHFEFCILNFFMNLSTALRNIHADPLWWRKVFFGGALNLSIVGAPWTAGLETESLENVRKGFPSPLPPNIDPSARYVIGLFSLIIDFFFFLLPLLMFGILLVCGLAALTFGQNGGGINSSAATWIVVGVVLAFEAAMFGLGVAPIGKLLYVQEGAPEKALGMATMRMALAAERRAVYGRARLQSLPGYIPLVLLAVAVWASLQLTFPGSWLLTALLLWLALSALVYAHLVVMQLYGAAERSLG